MQFKPQIKISPNMPMKHTGPLGINPILSIKTCGYHLSEQAHCCQVFWSSNHWHVFYSVLPLINFHIYLSIRI